MNPFRSGISLAAIVCSLACGAPRILAAEGPQPAPPASGARAILSTEGSGRATAYPEQNKIITLNSRTHVVWLDAVAEGFRVRGRTLDHTTGEWSPVTTIGEAQDNHGGPALTVDSKGFLHIVYYPHHQAVRYRRSVQPNDLSHWEEEERFGDGLSYPSLLCAPDDTLIVAARRGFFGPDGKYLDKHYLEEELWIKSPGSSWQRQSVLIRGRFPRYAQFASGLVWSPDRKTIHLGGRIYESSPDPMGKPTYTIVYMKTSDLGKTWTKADGTPLTLPVNADSIDVLEADDPGTGLQLNSGPLAVDRDGVPHVLYTAKAKGHSQLVLATPAKGAGWDKRDLADVMPSTVRGWEVNLGMGGGMSISDTGRATIVAVVLAPPAEEVGTLKEWGHPTTEVVRLWSDDGLKTFHSEVLAPMDPGEPHWLANIERPTGHNRVPEKPGIIFLGGVAGAGLKDLMLSNRVYWQPGN
ncbi:MAG: BNR-4 repeat-containing protein [Opitutus sp.]